jgi:hypothetical protein
MPESSSSKKGHNGSARGSSHSHSHKHKHHSKESEGKDKLVDRFVRDERDYRSYAVTEYDPLQEEARRRREERLRDVVGRRY